VVVVAHPTSAAASPAAGSVGTDDGDPESCGSQHRAVVETVANRAASIGAKSLHESPLTQDKPLNQVGGVLRRARPHFDGLFV
jgi:hypothetical protein